jgi:putative peptidoglycan lipid II flippase
LLPYLITVCFAAITAAALQTLGRFAVPALAPAVLNLFWIVGALVIAPHVSDQPTGQAYAMAVCLLIGGLLQWLIQWIPLRREGFRFQRDPPATRDELRHIRRGIVPTILGLAVLQINTLLDSVIAWIFSAPVVEASVSGLSPTISWLGGVHYPMDQGATAAIYLGERMYQLPVGLLGIAVATVVFPLVSRHAARGDLQAVSHDLTRGLQFVLLGAIPCAIGLVLLAEPIARLLFERGRFTSEDSLRTARMIAVYGSGVWAYCSLPVLVRGFYALGDRTTPLRIALFTVVLNLIMDFILIWPLAERGLATATAAAAAIQAIVLALVFSRRKVPLNWRRLGESIIPVSIASALMAVATWFVLHIIPENAGTWNALWRGLGPMAAGGIMYGVTIAAIGRAHLRNLFSEG